MFLGIAAAQIIIFAYFVVSTEMLLLWNPYQSNGPTWGFGQILALIVVVPSGVSVFNAFRERGFKRLHRAQRSKRSKPAVNIV